MLLAVVLFVAGFLQFFQFDRIPGDLQDARFNMYVLEHGYRWLVHLDNSFWSAPFFYPASNVITYSDNHLGSLLFYCVFRVFGASRESAFQLWAITIFALNYFITWLVLKKQNFHPIGAIASAYIFTFPMIMAAQIIHIQLAPRFMVPVAFWMAYVFLGCGKPRFLCLFFAACAYQIYLGIYIGYFLVLSLAPFCATLIFYRKQWIEIRSFIANGGTWVVLRRSIEYVVSCIGFVLVLLPLIVPYHSAQQEIGGRNWNEVIRLLPRWRSYVYAPSGSVLWGKIVHFGDLLPSFRWEHQLFLGFFPCICILIFLYLFLKGKLALPDRPRGLAMMSVLITLGVLTFSFAGFSLYRYVWDYFPGAGGIRGVTRIVLVLVYPIAFICGAVVTYFLNRRPVARLSWTTGILVIGILTLVVVDQASGVASISKRECQIRIGRMKVKIAEGRNNDLDRTILWVDDEGVEPYFVKNLDAMLASQDLGLNVVNGYSGSIPNGYPPALLSQVGDCCAELGFWVGMHPGTITNNALLQIGSHCEIPDVWVPVPIKGFSVFAVAKTIHMWATDRTAELGIAEIPSKSDAVILSVELSTPNLRSIRISEPDGRVQTVTLVPGALRHMDIPILLSKGEYLVKFQTDTEGVKPGNGDPRTLYAQRINQEYTGAHINASALFFEVANPHILPANSKVVPPNQVND
jgi:hypothetical protein